MQPQPTDLSLLGDALLIRWSDGAARSYPIRELRDSCPCATCREKRRQPPAESNPFTVLSPAETQPVKLLGMTPVGNYAYAMKFSDGHDTGIFTLEQLRVLGRPEPA